MNNAPLTAETKNINATREHVCFRQRPPTKRSSRQRHVRSR